MFGADDSPSSAPTCRRPSRLVVVRPDLSTEVSSGSTASRINVHRGGGQADGVLDVEGLADVEGFAGGHSDERADVAPAVFELFEEILLADARDGVVGRGVVELRAVRADGAQFVLDVVGDVPDEGGHDEAR